MSEWSPKMDSAWLASARAETVDDAGQQLTSDFIHVGDHQQKALRSGVGGGQSTGRQRAVHGTGSACLGLHLNDLDFLAEDVLLALGSPFVRHFRHNGRGGDGIDGSHDR